MDEEMGYEIPETHVFITASVLSKGVKGSHVFLLSGMDAQVAYGFHHLRNEKPYLAQGPILNKIIYLSFSCKQGWFFTPFIADPSLRCRGLNNILRLHVKRLNSTQWEPITIPSSVRSIVALNLHSNASGRNQWGNLKPDNLQKSLCSFKHSKS